VKPRGSGLSLARAGARRRGFYLGSIPQVAAGYFWDPASASGSALASFALPEGSGRTTHNMITPAVETAPAIGTINGQAVITYTNQAAADDLARTAATTRGWTGETYFAAWFNMATAAGFVFGHYRTAQNFAVQFNAGDVRVYGHDGTALREYRFPVPPGGYAAGPFFCEAAFVPSAGATNRLQLWYGLAAQTPSVTASMGASLQDSSEVLTFGGTAGDATALNITATFSHGVAVLASGIPSAADRARFMAHKRLA
jgi:hypothetical protein